MDARNKYGHDDFYVFLWIDKVSKVVKKPKPDSRGAGWPSTNSRKDVDARNNKSAHDVNIGSYSFDFTHIN